MSWYRVFPSSCGVDLEGEGEGEGRGGSDSSRLAGEQFVGGFGEKAGRREDYLEENVEAMVNVSAGDS